ncbi:MAG: hypothetical protein KZQ93_04725 [Candidatus Thiodiazotropha sp. (ex Monitilora ramsayi)]|nr:hypothetical protein [Candidatus Thiodiazotropha sp. (ex Monitilora ramsayi)]
MGKAQYEVGNFDNALSSFKATLGIHPSWEKDWVQPYYEKIENAKKSANK